MTPHGSFLIMAIIVIVIIVTSLIGMVYTSFLLVSIFNLSQWILWFFVWLVYGAGVAMIASTVYELSRDF